MAVTQRDDAHGMIQPDNASRAGVAGLLGAAVLAVAPLVYMKLIPTDAIPQGVLLAVGLVLAAIIAIGTVQVLRGVGWGQTLAVGLWIVVGCGGLLVLVASLLGALPEGWPAGWKTSLAAAVLLVLGAVETVLMHLASEPRSRQRYASTALVTTGEIFALLLVINVIAQTSYVRINAETLGRFGLSDRSRRVLENVDAEITLTCVYTAGEAGKGPAEYRSRLLELLEEMQEFRPDKVDVRNVVTDGGRARLMARLAREREQKHADHIAFIQAFQQSAQELQTALPQDTDPLLVAQDDSYLDQWRLRATVGQQVGELTREIETTRKKIARNLRSGVIEYGQLVSDANDVVSTTQQFISSTREALLERARLPQAVEQTAPNAVAAVDAAIEESKAVPAALIDPNGASIKDMKASIAKMAEALESTSQACAKAAEQLRQVGGELFPLVYQSDAWSFIQMPIDRYFSRTANDLQQEAVNYRRAAAMLNGGDELRVALRNLRPSADGLPPALSDSKAALKSAIASLTHVDRQTEALFQAVREKTLMSRTASIVNRLAKLAANLPETDDWLADELADENIVLLEVGDQKTVVPFDEVWPMTIQAAPDSDEPDARRFNGDSAIASALLKLVRKPFAKVILTHFTPPTPQQMHPMMQRMMPSSSLPPEALTALQDRLRKANFLVEQWNLTDPAPWTDPNTTDANAPDAASVDKDKESKLPRVLLICPPATSPMADAMREQIPQFGPEHEAKIRAAIDEGIGAVFLTHFHVPESAGMYGGPPTSPPYPLDDYLKNAWGIDPLNEFIVFPASRDPQQPDRLTPNLQWFSHMPLSAYTDHPIGKPLQGRRTLWPMVCPVTAVSPLPEGVSVRPVLRVPASMDTVWASRHFMDLIRQFQGAEQSAVSPQFDDGDMRPPFPVAMAATRSGAPTADTRIVVLGVGAGLADQYLNEPVLQLREDGGSKLTDPPSANADLVINSCLWLTGWDQYIASGPTYIHPIDMIDPVEMDILWSIYVVGIPGVVLAIGMVVMAMRRRQ
ncbi:MAG: hypothetical protein ACLFVH_09135 [Phycisphaerae bacterium]